MKKILLFCLICFILGISDDLKGPSINPKHYDSDRLCVDYFPWDEDEVDWYDNFAKTQGLDIPIGASDCIDTLLWDKYDDRYYDRCCYVRFLIKGQMHQGCIALTESQYSDITESIRRMEEGDKAFWVSEAKGSKIYQLDCASTYIKTLSFIFVLIYLIL